MHAIVVDFEFVGASEAVAFSAVLASDERALELEGVAAVLSSGVTLEVAPTF